jgi:hypothetical protein
MTRRLASFLIFSLDKELIEILLVPLGGTKPKLLSVFTVLEEERYLSFQIAVTCH